MDFKKHYLYLFCGLSSVMISLLLRDFASLHPATRQRYQEPKASVVIWGFAMTRALYEPIYLKTSLKTGLPAHFSQGPHRHLSRQGQIRETIHPKNKLLLFIIYFRQPVQDLCIIALTFSYFVRIQS